MTQTDIYSDISKRTGKDIYIGVVGPVRTGKSTFIKKFMETLVLPNIENEFVRSRTTDELPQSAAGKTVMTTEPKFIPNEAVEIKLDENTSFRVKAIDCVGYIVPGALGLFEEGQPRMVITPWSEQEMPFEKAAEIGTQKVINEHSTIGFLVTTDGTIGDIPKENYADAEQRVVDELKAINKPFVIILNSAYPETPEATSHALKLEEKYKVPVALVNCTKLCEKDIIEILKLTLMEFPVKEIQIKIPRWTYCLDQNHPLKKCIYEKVCQISKQITKVGQIKEAFEDFKDNAFELEAKLKTIDLSCGKANFDITCPEKLFYSVLGDETGFEIENDEDLTMLLRELCVIKKEYDRVKDALQQVKETGYGIVTPSVDELTLEEPEIVKQQGSYGVKLRASAPSIHMIRANIKTEVNPIVGSEKQSEDMVKFLLKEFEEDPAAIWDSNMFGKTLHELVNEGLNAKLSHMPKEARQKIADTLQKIINEGSGGLICIIL